MKLKSILAAVILLNVTGHAFAQTPSAVISGKTSCEIVRDTDKPFVLILKHGDDLLKTITQCAKDAHLTSASISGLGQVHNPTLAYFTSNPNDKPTLTSFSGYYELAGLNGNITNNNGDYYTHIHAVLADKKFRGIAGHVDHAKAGLTVEITIVPLPTSVKRAVDEKTGFGLIVE